MISAIGKRNTVDGRGSYMLSLNLSMTDIFFSAAQRHVNFRYRLRNGIFSSAEMIFTPDFFISL